VDRESPAPTTVDEYIAVCPPEALERLTALRRVISEAVPEATEKISYGMPTFVLNGNLIHYAAHAHHIGVYPMPSGVEEFREELSSYQTAKGSVQFPLDRPMPYELIVRIVRFRAAEKAKKRR
jgi:uncharacterized protein YdhG (YjbR/CyaY superfamily)